MMTGSEWCSYYTRPKSQRQTSQIVFSTPFLSMGGCMLHGGLLYTTKFTSALYNGYTGGVKYSGKRARMGRYLLSYTCTSRCIDVMRSVTSCGPIHVTYWLHAAGILAVSVTAKNLLGHILARYRPSSVFFGLCPVYFMAG